MINTLRNKIANNPWWIIGYFLRHYFSSLMSDEKFIKWEYFSGMGKFPNLEHPRTYNEKLQWLKLNDIHPEYSKMVDKYEAKEYVRSIIGNGSFSLSTLRYMSMEYSAILGAESIFLKILPERGIIGVIAYIYMYYVLYSKLRIVMPIRQIQFFLVCYFVMEVAGGQKDMTLFFGILIATSRLMRLRRLSFLKKMTNECSVQVKK